MNKSMSDRMNQLMNVCVEWPHSPALAGYPPYPVHRLDMMTSGVLVMAKHQKAARPLAFQFRSERLALCVCLGDCLDWHTETTV